MARINSRLTRCRVLFFFSSSIFHRLLSSFDDTISYYDLHVNTSHTVQPNQLHRAQLFVRWRDSKTNSKFELGKTSRNVTSSHSTIANCTAEFRIAAKSHSADELHKSNSAFAIRIPNNTLSLYSAPWFIALVNVIPSTNRLNNTQIKIRPQQHCNRVYDVRVLLMVCCMCLCTINSFIMTSFIPVDQHPIAIFSLDELAWHASIVYSIVDYGPLVVRAER